MRSYRTARLENGKVSIVTAAFTPESLARESLVIEINYMGICRADVKEIIGSRDIPKDRGPLFGHEIVGRIIFKTKGLTSYQIGDRVTFNPNITPNRTTGYAEILRVSGSVEEITRAVIKIPDLLNPNDCWLPEPFACIVHSYKILLHKTSQKSLKNKKIAIIGAGNSGILFGLEAIYLGGEVSFFNRGEMRLAFIKNQSIVPSAKLHLFDQIPKHADEYDIVIVVPTKIDQEILKYSHQLVKNLGLVFLYGGTRANDKYLDTTLDIDKIRRNELLEYIQFNSKSVNVLGAYGCDTSDFEDAIKFYQHEHNHFPLEKLISKEIKLSDFPSLIESMAKGESDYPGKVLVKP